VPAPVADSLEVPKAPVLKGSDISQLLAQLLTPSLCALLAIVIFSLCRLLFRGSISDYAILLAGALLSGLSIISYGFLAVVGERSSWSVSFIAFSGLIPYGFGSYLCFYRGFWKLCLLWRHFSFIGLLSGITFVVIGYMVVNGIYLMSEFVKQTDSGRIRIEP
jgi:hypothetical protein